MPGQLSMTYLPQKGSARELPRPSPVALVVFVYNCHLFGSSADPFFKDFGFRTYTALLNNKSEDRFVWID